MPVLDSPMLRLRTLGDSSIEIGSTRIGPDSEVLFGLLLYLAVERGRRVARGRLRELFWPEVSESKAWHSLRQLLYRVRRMGLVVEAEAGHVLVVASAVDADFADIDGLVSRLASEACDIAVGVFLQGYSPNLSTSFSEWLEEERSIVHTRLRQGLVTKLVAVHERGDWQLVERLSRCLLAVDPLNEEGTLALAEATALTGSKAEAVAILDRYMADLGPSLPRRLDLPASLLRRRIAQRLPERSVTNPLDWPFIGREDSLGLLQRVISRATRGISESVYFWGPAGIGKTRLIDEISRAAAIQGLAVSRACARASDRQRPMSIFAELIPRLMRLPGALGAAPESLDLLRRFSLPPLAEIHAARAGEADFIAANIRNAVLDLVDALTGEQSLMLVVEDVHSADDRSHALITEVAAWAGPRRLALVCTSREPPASTPVAMLVQRLRPLADVEILALVKNGTQGITPAPGSLVLERVVQLSEGNPFYARELVAHWQETGTLTGLPRSLANLIDARLDALSADAILTLQTVALLDRHAAIPRLEATLGFPTHVLARSLQELEIAGLVGSEAGAARTSHDIIADAALARLGTLAARSLHRAIALAQEREGQTADSPDLLWDCARHWHLAGEPTRSVDFIFRCANQLLALGLARDATDLLAKVRSFCPDDSRLGELLRLQGVASYQALDWPGVRAALAERRQSRRLRASSTHLHDREELMLLEASWRCDLSSYDELINRARACIQCAEAPRDHRLGAGVECMKMAGNRCDKAITSSIYSQIRRIRATGTLEEGLKAEARMIFHTSFGEVDKGAEAAEQLITVRRRLGTPGALFNSLVNSAIPLSFAGRSIDAEAALLEALDIAKEHRLSAQVFAVHHKLAALKLSHDDLDGARSWYEDGKHHLGGISSTDAVPFHVTGVEVALGQGRHAEAISNGVALHGVEIPELFPRGAACLTAIRMRLLLLTEPLAIRRADVRCLHRVHLQIRSLGDHDLSALGLFAGLQAIGEGETAIRLYGEYSSKHRRERTPQVRALHEFGAALKICKP